MQRTFLVSDTHFGHKNIIEYENRPFKDVAEMDREMIKRWNALVHKDDKVFHLGDVSFYGRDLTRQIVQQLNGRKFLVMGNHDRGRSKLWWKEVGFEDVSEYPIIIKEFMILSHECQYMNEHMPYVNVHGHIHGQKFEGNKHINLCVEHWDYTPVSLEDVIAIAQK